MPSLASTHGNVDVKWFYEVPVFRCFGPFHPDVNGHLQFESKAELQNVISIKYGLVGLVEGKYDKKEYGGRSWPAFQDDLHLNTEREQQKIFEISLDLAPGGGMAKGVMIDRDFHFQFPWQSFYIPSCGTVGSNGWNEGTVNITYKVFVRITYFGSGSNNVDEYSSLLAYQGNSMFFSENPHQWSSYAVRAAFPRKVKAKVYDPKKDALVDTHLNESHRRTRKVFSVFDKKYQDENYNKLAMDVQISCIFATVQSFNLLESFSSQFQLTIRLDSPVEPGSNPTLEPDFKYKGESTGLGRFCIQRIALVDYFTAQITINGHGYTKAGSRELYAIEFKDNELEFDVADFEFNRQLGVFEKTIPTFPKDLTRESSVLQCLSSPVVMNGNATQMFSATSRVGFQVRIKTAALGKTHRKFNVCTDCNFDVRTPDAPPEYVDDGKVARVEATNLAPEDSEDEDILPDQLPKPSAWQIQDVKKANPER